MKNFFVVTAGSLFFMCFTNFKTQQNNYLPVYISLKDTTFSLPEIMLNIKACFAAKNIKTITKNDILAMLNNEFFSLGQDYKNSGGDINDFSKAARNILANMRKIGNSLTIDIRIDNDGFINDTIRWNNHSIPMDFSNPPKPNWHYMILDTTNAKTLLQMSQSIVDSIIASNVLVRE